MIGVTLNTFLGLIGILCLSCQMGFGSSVFFVFAKSISFYCKHVLHWGASVYFLTEVCDEIIYWRLIILIFLNLNCLRSLFILLAFYISFMGVFLKSVPNEEVLKDFSFSLLSWLYFLLVEILGRARKFWFDVYCWGPALIFLFSRPEMNSLTASGFGFESAF